MIICRPPRFQNPELSHAPMSCVSSPGLTFFDLSSDWEGGNPKSSFPGGTSDIASRFVRRQGDHLESRHHRLKPLRYFGGTFGFCRCGMLLALGAVVGEFGPLLSIMVHHGPS